jgi:L-lactate dehydrogenase complex protein LldG
VSAARDEILARVRAAVAGAPAAAPVQRAYRRGEMRGDTALLGERLVDYRAEVHRTRDVRTAAEDVLREHGAARIVVPAGFPAEWRPDGVELVEDGDLSPLELDALDGVLTGCTLAVAETGTIVLAAGAAEGRRALTLVPDLHVCVVRDDQVVDGLPAALARLDALVRDERRPLTFVSGPSATSDIELRRVEGVHGPRRLVVLLVE